MDGRKRMVVHDILANENVQYVVPIYQREYKWKKEQIERLIDDIFQCKTKTKEHFIGSIVYQNEENHDPSDQKMYLVDGQQRITTMMIIAKALNLIASDKIDDEDYKYVFNKTNRILFIDAEEPSRGYKLEPSKNDSVVFKRIINAKSLKDIEDDPLIKKDNLMYNNFKIAYNKLLEKINGNWNIKEDIYNKGLLMLSLVAITINYNEDAQEIFESINSLGVPLSNSDLIRNYLLMSNKNQKKLYEDYWEPIQDDIIGEDNMDVFVKNYLLLKKCYNIVDKDIYKEYVLFSKEFENDGEIDKEAMLKDLFFHAKIFKPFINYSKDFSNETNKLTQELREMDQTTAYPFLMKVFIDLKDKDTDTLNKVLNLIIVYLVRRIICGVPSNTLRGFMLNLYNRVFKVEKNKEKYYESIYAFLKSIKTSDALRTEKEVELQLMTAPLYRNSKFTTYLLYRLENGRYPSTYTEEVVTKAPTIEHIMPQELTEEWVEDLGENYEKIHLDYLDTLGNLSLSSRSKNSVMSNESFDVKKKILNDDGSKFKVLNDDVIKLNKFTEKEIITRCKRLSSIVADKYKLNAVNIKGIKFEDTVSIITSKEVSYIYNGAVPVSFELFNNEIYVNSFIRILIELLKILLSNYPEIIKKLALENYNPWVEHGKPYLYCSDNAPENSVLIGDDIRLDTALNSVSIVEFCVKLLEKCDIPVEELIINLKKDSIKKENLIDYNQKVSLIRSALKELADENIIIYDEINMPKSNDWIKFQIPSLVNPFKINNVTKWDGELFNSVYYSEYNVKNNYVVITIKNINEVKEKVAVIYKNKDYLVLNEFSKNSTWIHLLKQNIDFNQLFDSEDDLRTNKLKEMLIEIVKNQEIFANKIKELL